MSSSLLKSSDRTAAARVGDATNLALVALSVVYIVLVFGHARKPQLLDLSGLFGEHWSRDGFCLSFKDSPWAHTHLLCLYGDLILGSLLYVVAKRVAVYRPELSQARDSAPSVIMHGLGHGLLWLLDDNLSAIPIDEPIFHSLSPRDLLATCLLVLVFWYSFLVIAFPAVAPLSQCAIHTILVLFVLPRLLLFGYINTVLFCNIGMLGYFRKEGLKDRFYVLAALANVPIMAATWAEPLLCDVFLIHWGGHIIFDYSIPLSTLGALAIAVTLMEPRDEDSTTQKTE